MGEKGNAETTAQSATGGLITTAESAAGNVAEAGLGVVAGAATGLAEERVHDQLDHRITTGKVKDGDDASEADEGGSATPSPA